MAKEEKKEPTASERLAEIMKASPKLGVDDLFSKPQLLQRDMLGIPFAIIGATVARDIGGELIRFVVDIPEGHIEGVSGEAEVTAPITANNLKIVAYFGQNKEGKVTGATFAKQGREYYIAKYKAPEPTKK